MRGFLILCLIAVVAAGRLGYDYRPNGGGLGLGGLSGGLGLGSSGSSQSIGLGGLGGGLSSGLGSGLSTGLGSGFNGGISTQSSGLVGGLGVGLGGGLSSGLGGGLGGGLGIGLGGGLSSGLGSGLSAGLGSGLSTVLDSGLSSGLGGGFSTGLGSLQGSNIITSNAPLVTEYNKEFYFHSAPEEDLPEPIVNNRLTSTLKKNLRVVFIKAPENNGLTNAALQIARHATEDKTAIYVLTKQNDVSQLTNQIQQIQEHRSQKPEVRFIKYRTPQDAINAQRAIQAQYDALGGSSRSSDEGVAPVLNYASSNSIGSYQNTAPELSSASSSSLGSVALSAPSGSYLSPKPSYLPPIQK